MQVLSNAGFQVVGGKGSHVRLKKKTLYNINIVIVPIHPEIKKGTLKSIIRQSGLTAEEFERHL
ncbi:MAG: type II toxin-antitoxin system HicA family toxin [Nitrososphaerota archaeon]|nr:type II toxin-antitoxin system HicA family toxin [Nitrososphaerota archaeon]